MPSNSDLKYGDPDHVEGGVASGFSTGRYVPQDSFLNSDASNLSSYAAENLRPDAGFNDLLGRGMDALAAFLRNDTSFNVKEVFKGGSAGKGTTIRGKSDIDVIVFLNDFRSYDDFGSKINGTIVRLERALRNFGGRGGHRVIVEGTTRFCVKISLTPNGLRDAVDMDVLPAFDSLESRDNPRTDKTFRDMARASGNRQFYFSSICPLQVDFVKTRPAAVKDLIRLVKFWRKTHFEERSDMTRSLPTSYTLELLTIHCWEMVRSPPSFNLSKGFKAVMSQLVHYSSIDCEWSKYYKPSEFHGEISSLKAKAKRSGIPFILDPANPFNNTAARFRAWDEVAHMARHSLAKLSSINCANNWA